MGGRFNEIPLGEVDREEDTFRCSMERDVGPLRASLRSVGVLIPLRVQAHGGRFRIVSGFLRAEAAGAEEMRKVPAETAAGDAKSLLLGALHENRFSRGFTWAERGWVLARLCRRWGAERSWILEQAMPAMGLSPAPRVLEDHLRLANLSDAVTRKLVRMGCSMGNALRLSGWAPPDQEAVAGVIPLLHLGENTLRECLEKIREIGLGEGVSPRDLLADSEFQAILGDPDTERPLRTERFRAWLNRRRYPGLVAMQGAFHRARSEMNLPPEISLQPAPFFETRGVTVSFRARNAKEFASLSRRLGKAGEETQKIDTLFRATEEPPS